MPVGAPFQLASKTSRISKNQQDQPPLRAAQPNPPDTSGSAGFFNNADQRVSRFRERRGPARQPLTSSPSTTTATPISGSDTANATDAVTLIALVAADTAVGVDSTAQIGIVNSETATAADTITRLALGTQAEVSDTAAGADAATLVGVLAPEVAAVTETTQPALPLNTYPGLFSVITPTVRFREEREATHVPLVSPGTGAGLIFVFVAETANAVEAVTRIDLTDIESGAGTDGITLIAGSGNNEAASGADSATFSAATTAAETSATADAITQVALGVAGEIGEATSFSDLLTLIALSSVEAFTVTEFPNVGVTWMTGYFSPTRPSQKFREWRGPAPVSLASAFTGVFSTTPNVSDTANATDVSVEIDLSAADVAATAEATVILLTVGESATGAEATPTLSLTAIEITATTDAVANVGLIRADAGAATDLVAALALSIAEAVAAADSPSYSSVTVTAEVAVGTDLGIGGPRVGDSVAVVDGSSLAVFAGAGAQEPVATLLTSPGLTRARVVAGDATAGIATGRNKVK